MSLLKTIIAVFVAMFLMFIVTLLAPPLIGPWLEKQRDKKEKDSK